MKKLFFPLLSLCLLTTACKDSVPSPTIEMQGLYVNDGEMDYTRQMEALPPLKLSLIHISEPTRLQLIS